jgi:iron(III) transport system ATP-binding protein
MRLRTPAGPLQAVCPGGVQAGEQVSLSIRPENIRLHSTERAATNVLPGVVEQLMFLGEYLDCRVRVGDALLLSRQHPSAPLSRGDGVFVELPVEQCAVITDTRGVACASPEGEEREREASRSATLLTR